MKNTRHYSALRLGFAGAALIAGLLPVVAYNYPYFTGISSEQAWWLVMVAAGVSLSVATLGTAWQWAGLLASALLVGTSSQLGLTTPTWFQEIHLGLDTKFHIALYLAIAGQMVVALFVLFTRGAWSFLAAALRSLGAGRVALFVLLMVAVSATAMNYIAQGDVVGYLIRLSVATAFLLINVATVMALALVLPDRRLAVVVDFLCSRISFPGQPPRQRGYDHFLPCFVAAWVLIVASLICIFSFERMAHLGDELAYVLQARYFSLGHLSAEIPSVSLAPAFDYEFFVPVGDKWFSCFPPGWPLVLTLGVLANLEWLVNPILGAASVLLVHALFRREFDRATANVVVLLMGISPWFLAMSASLMSHTLTLALWIGACLLLSIARTAPAHRAPLLAILAGFLMGLLFLARPLDGLVAGTLTGLWAFKILANCKGLRAVFGYGLGCFVVGALVFPYNAYLTGDPLLTPIDSYFEHRWDTTSHQLGFGSDVGPPKPWHGVDIHQGHSPGEAAIFGQHNVFMLNFELFGWAVGSLSLFFFHALWGRRSRTDNYMLGLIAATVAAYGFYWGAGGFHLGPRYWFMTFLPCVAISASGIATVRRKLQSVAGIEGGTPVGHRIACVIVALSAVSMVSFVTWRGTTKYFEIRHFHSDYRALLRTHELGNGLVFIRNAMPSELGSASFFNPTRLDSPQPIFVRDLGVATNRAVANAFPGRPIYLAVGRGDDGTPAHIVAGPLTLQALP